MSETYEVKAEAREKVGKGAARHLRRNGMVPAVIYGGKQEPLPIAIPYKETFLRLHAGGFKTTVATVDVNGQKIKVIPKDYQLDPVRDFLIHVDFLRISDESQITVSVPVHFHNEEASPGLKRGGTLNVVRHDVEVHCPATAIPTALDVDLTGLEIGDSVHASAVTLPAGVTFVITERDFTIATIASTAGLSSSENAGEATPAVTEQNAKTTDEGKRG